MKSFIDFIRVFKGTKTPIFEIRNRLSNEKLGEIRWIPSFRAIGFTTENKKIDFSIGCQKEIYEKSEFENAKYKSERGGIE